ncbi:hypothetical protein BOX15_Mlig000541g2, partial [Macrostomum lignano]
PLVLAPLVLAPLVLAPLVLAPLVLAPLVLAPPRMRPPHPTPPKKVLAALLLCIRTNNLLPSDRSLPAIWWSFCDFFIFPQLRDIKIYYGAIGLPANASFIN